MQRTNESGGNRCVYHCWALFLGLISIVALLSVDRYGVSWDEVFRSGAGDQKLAYYTALFTGEFAQADLLRGEADGYPGLFDLLNALAREIVPMDGYLLGHLLSTTFGLLGIFACMLLGRTCFGPWAGLFAGIALACTMRYWGHMFINPKDIPFAATFALGAWGLMRVLHQEQPSWPSGVLFGLLAGASMSVRIGGLLLFAYAACFLGLRVLRRWREADWQGKALFHELLPVLRWMLLAASVAFATLALFWPALHKNPFATTASTVQTVSNFGWEGIVRYGGEWLRVSELPTAYPIQWLAMTLPDLWYLIAGTALIVWVVRLRKSAPVNLVANVTALHFSRLLLMALFPLVYILVRGSTVYDGMRHILFIVPILAVCLGFLVTWVSAAIRGRRALQLAWAGLLAVGAGAATLDGLRLHPYQYIYFNRVSGGLAEKGKAYEHDYWGTAYREGAEWLSTELPPKPDGNAWRLTMQPPLETLVRFLGKPVVPPPDLVRPFLRKDIELVGADQGPELYIASTRTNYHRMREGTVLHTVERSGIVLLQVKLLPHTPRDLNPDITLPPSNAD